MIWTFSTFLVELEDKVKMILKLIKDGDLVMDGTLEEIWKREPLAELVKDIGSITNELNVLQNKVESLEQVKSDLEAQNGEKNLQQAKLVEEKNNLASQLRNLKEKSEMLEAKVKEEESENLKAKVWSFVGPNKNLLFVLKTLICISVLIL
jgi:3-polyprenyl-4-hydroxybenzoate decarboxylase